VLCGLIAEYSAREPYGHNLRAILEPISKTL